MKKALGLLALFLCAQGSFAAADQRDAAAEGKKRNEQAYERMLEQTGWKNEKISRDSTSGLSNPHDRETNTPQPKSS